MKVLATSIRIEESVRYRLDLEPVVKRLIQEERSFRNLDPVQVCERLGPILETAAMNADISPDGPASVGFTLNGEPCFVNCPVEVLGRPSISVDEAGPTIIIDDE